MALQTSSNNSISVVFFVFWKTQLATLQIFFIGDSLNGLSSAVVLLWRVSTSARLDCQFLVINLLLVQGSRYNSSLYNWYYLGFSSRWIVRRPFLFIQNGKICRYRPGSEHGCEHYCWLRRRKEREPNFQLSLNFKKSVSLLHLWDISSVAETESDDHLGRCNWGAPSFLFWPICLSIQIRSSTQLTLLSVTLACFKLKSGFI